MLSRLESSTNPSFETMFLRPEGLAVPSPGFREATPRLGGSMVVIEDSTLPPPDKIKLLYHVNRTIGNLRLCILLAVAPDVLQIANKEGHPGFSHCYEIVTRFWYIQGLTRLLREFIRHCPQCLQFQTRRHCPYGSLQPIESPQVPFFTLTLDVMLALPLTKQGFNTIMSVICKFSKRVTLIEGANTWSAEHWA